MLAHPADLGLRRPKGLLPANAAHLVAAWLALAGAAGLVAKELVAAVGG